MEKRPGKHAGHRDVEPLARSAQTGVAGNDGHRRIAAGCMLSRQSDAQVAACDLLAARAHYPDPGAKVAADGKNLGKH